MQVEFDVFLSHNRLDKPAVRAICKSLRERGLRPWLDEEELIPGQPWQDALEEVIGSIRSAAVLVGRDGIGPWEGPEMRAMLREFVRRRLPVIPVLLPGAGVEPRLPVFLQDFTWVDMRSGIGGDPLDRLVWGITGKKRPELTGIGPKAQPRAPLHNPIVEPPEVSLRPDSTTRSRPLAAPPQPPVAPAISPSSKGIMIVLSYLWPLVIVPLLVKPKDDEVRWHARHGLVLLIAEVSLWGAYLLVQLGLIVGHVYSLGFVLELAFLALVLGILVTHVICIVWGLKGRRLLIPGISRYAGRF
jgi:TIR domain